MQNYKGYAELLEVLDSRIQRVMSYETGIATSMIGFVKPDNSLVLDWAGGSNPLPPSAYYVCEGLLEHECTGTESLEGAEIKTKRRYLPEGQYLVIHASGIICVVDRLIPATQV